MNAPEFGKKAEEALKTAMQYERGSYERRDWIQIAQVYAQLSVAAAVWERP